MFEKVKRHMFPVPLSRGLEIARRFHGDESSTWRWYSTPINQLIKRYGDIHIHDVTERQMRDWHSWVCHNSYSPWTVDSYTRSIKAFFNHMVEVGHIDKSPAVRLRLSKLPRKDPKDIPLDDIPKMIAKSKFNARDHALIRLLADSGCRVGELLSMTVSTVEMNDAGGRAIVLGKGYKTRFIFFGPESSEAISLYLESRPWNAPDDLWLNREGLPFTNSGVYQLFRRLGKRAGVKRFNPHAFRHAFAKRLIDEGAPPKVVSGLLGHSDITTTLNQYVNYTDKELQDHHGRYLRDW